VIVLIKHYLCGKRIYLREVRETDANDDYYRWLNDPEVNQYLETRYIVQSKELIKKYIQDKQSSLDEPFFAICLIDNDRHIGNIKLGPINWIHRKADVSLFIGTKDLWGKGYASEAISLISDYAFNILGLNKLKAGAYAENTGSIKAFEKCGFKKEGVFKDDVLFEGELLDSVILGLTIHSYRSRGNCL
jgi:[ribosomal protein S5]-alanine N-acetyltransferase